MTWRAADELGISLRARGSSRSFAGMRVEAVERISKPLDAKASALPDATSLATKNFIAVLASEDSLLELRQPLGMPAAEDATRPHALSGHVVLAFKETERRFQRQLHFVLVEKLIELLKDAGSKDTLEAQLCLTARNATSSSPAENTLHIRLTANGDSEEQAMLRWGLGLTHLQQALLFTSRHLRQQITHDEG